MARRRKLHKMTSARRAALRKAQLASAKKRRRRRTAAAVAVGIGLGVGLSIGGKPAYRRGRDLYKSRNTRRSRQSLIVVSTQKALPPGKSTMPTAARAHRQRQRAQKVKYARTGVTPHTSGKGVFKVSINGRVTKVARNRPGYDAQRRKEYKPRPRQKYGPRRL